MEIKDLKLKFKPKEIAVPIAAAAITAVIVVLIFFAAIVSNYGAAMASGESSRIKKAEVYANMADETEKNSVVFFGDSITEMYDLKKYFPNRNYINRGIGGDRTIDLISRMDSNVVALEPSAVVILIGTNDLNDFSPQETFENYKILLDGLTSALPDAKFIIESVLPICTLPTAFSRIIVNRRTNEKIIELNGKIEEYCRELVAKNGGLNLVYADMFSVLEDGGKLNAAYALDGLHINELGYAALSGALNRYLE